MAFAALFRKQRERSESTSTASNVSVFIAPRPAYYTLAKIAVLSAALSEFPLPLPAPSKLLKRLSKGLAKRVPYGAVEFMVCAVYGSAADVKKLIYRPLLRSSVSVYTSEFLNYITKSVSDLENDNAKALVVYGPAACRSKYYFQACQSGGT